MENIYSENGLQFVINASGRMTKLGVSSISKTVGEALIKGATNYVVIDDLMAFAGKKIGSMIGAEDACITSSASAGIALSVASLICGNNLQKVQHLFEILPNITRREIILLKGQNIDFGAPVAEMIQLGGGKIREVGFANGTRLSDIENAVNENTLAIFYVKSHHCVQKNMIDIQRVAELCNRIKVPCIVDASAEEDLRKYIQMGADYVCYSGAKAISGPTSGFVACRKSNFAENMRLQYKGIGRAMKIGKEGIMGLLKAVEEYLEGFYIPIVKKADLESFACRISQIPGCIGNIVQDEAGREIYRCKITFAKEEYGMNAKEVVKKLREGPVAIFTRDYEANIGSIAIDPRPLNSLEELNIIFTKIQDLGKREK